MASTLSQPAQKRWLGEPTTPTEPSAYLSLSQLPIARSTAGEAKFSLAMSLRCERWSASSWRMLSATSGRAAPTTSRAARKAIVSGEGAEGVAVVVCAFMGVSPSAGPEGPGLHADVECPGARRSLVSLPGGRFHLLAPVATG